jgi:ABC-type ATPase involved in cell division
MAPELQHAAQLTIGRSIAGERVDTYEVLRHAERQNVLDFVALLRREHPEAQLARRGHDQRLQIARARFPAPLRRGFFFGA